MTKREALRAIRKHRLTVLDVLGMMPEGDRILEHARKSRFTLRCVLRNAAYLGGDEFKEELIRCIRLLAKERAF